MRVTMIHLFLLTVLMLTISFVWSTAQAPPTVEQELRKYGIPIRRSDLQSALSDNRPVVRGLAASELAEMKDVESVSLIVAALDNEGDPKVRFNMASALVRLGSQVGNQELTHICDDATSPDDHRLNAAHSLVVVGDYSCLSSIQSIMRTTTNSGVKVFALQTLARVKVIPASLAPAIHSELLASLQYPDSSVRLYASKCIASLGDKAAAPNLRAAIARERDRPTRKQMEESLSMLEK